MSLNDPANPAMDPQNPKPEETKTTTTSPDPKGTFQDRVNQLTRRASEAERAAAATISENSELKAQLSRLESQISQLASRPPPAAPTMQPQVDFSATPQEGNLDALVAKITENVLGAVQPVIQKVQEDTANTQLAAKQKQSFDAAARVHPELADPNSALFQTFAKLWDGRPDLHLVDGAPQILAEAARGLLSEARANEQVQKLAAANTTPRAPRALDEVNDDSEINETLQNLAKEGKEEGWTSDDFSDFLSLKFKQFGRSR